MNGSEGRLVGKLTNETLWSFWRDYGRHFAFAAWRKQDVVWFMSVVCSWIHDKVAITSAWWTLTRVWVMLKMNKSAYKNFTLAIIDYLLIIMMIRFSTRAINLHLATQGEALTGEKVLSSFWSLHLNVKHGLLNIYRKIPEISVRLQTVRKLATFGICMLTSDPKLWPNSCITVIVETFLGTLRPKFKKVTSAVLKHICWSLSGRRTLSEHIPPGTSSSGCATQAIPKTPLEKSR